MFGDSHARSHDSGSDDPTDLATDALDDALDDAQVEAAPPEADAVALVPTPPVTGDEAVDEAMTRLAAAQAGSFAERIESGEHAHRSLQSRLGALGGA
ncbi:hypothetical protein [Terrabacter sp. BE26]|uniref:hypothetical protein n=1 Tax=Terrabacter sp. BE26 TaxID=2898152 RepID=UPI0035BE69BE